MCWNVYFWAQKDYMINLSLACSTVIVTAAITKMAMSYMLRMLSCGTDQACLLQNGSIIENHDNMDTIIVTLENHQSLSSTVYILHRNTPTGITHPHSNTHYYAVPRFQQTSHPMFPRQQMKIREPIINHSHHHTATTTI